MKRRSETRGERNIRWIERFCRVPSGMNVGKSVVLREWQRDIIRSIYDNPAGTRRAIVSFGRKNGKTALASFLLLLHLVGPEAIENGELYSAAQTRDQAAILFKLARQTVERSPDLLAKVTIRESSKSLLCHDLGTIYQALSSDASSALGKSPCFLVHDELGQVRGPSDSLYENLESATGGQGQPLSIVISTQSPNPTDLLSVLIDDALAGHDPRVVVSLFTCADDVDPFWHPVISDSADEDEIAAAEAQAELHLRKVLATANPAFGDFQNATETLAMAADAKRMPAREADFRNLILNQRVEMNAPFVSRSVWQANAGEPAPLSGPVYGGLDLSSVNDLTAKVYLSWQDGAFHVQPTFWLPAEGLAEKSRADRKPYDQWAHQGLIEASPGKTISWERVAQSLYSDCQTMDVRKINFDRWQWTHFKPWLLRAGFREDQLEGPAAIFQPFGQGFQSMSPALNTLEADLLEDRLRHGGHPVLSMCAANAVVVADPAGNRKLDKSKATGRIDGMVALAMARAAAGTDHDKPEPRYRVMLI